MTALSEVLLAARAAFETHRWSEAVSGFEGQGGFTGLEPEDVERLAWSLTWAGQSARACLDSFERVEAAFQRVDDGRGASRAALEQARIHALVGNEVVSAACWARAVDYLKGDRECAEYGMALALGAYARLLEADHEGVRHLAGMALETGRRVDDRTVEATASHLLGHAALMSGNVAAGVALLDGALSIAVTGAVAPMYAGTIYCGVLWACREMGDWRRAAQWDTVASRWCEREAVVHFPAHLSAHRAELARIQGKLVEAEQAALDALDQAGDWNRDLVAWAHSLVGEARLVLGDLDGARAAFSEAAKLGFDPEPGNAHLLFIQGRPEAALRAITRAIDRPHWYAFSNLVYALPTGVSIALALGRLDTAALWCDQLDELARNYGTPGPRASARVARGELALAERRFEVAVEELRLGVEQWAQTGAPYQSARARVTLARALRASGEWDMAWLEMEAARATFDRIGARHEGQLVRRLLDQQEAASVGDASRRQQTASNEFEGLTPRQQEVAALVARGLTNGRIAEALFISRYTAETHVKHILAQLGFSSRAEIAVWASQQGLLDRA